MARTPDAPHDTIAIPLPDSALGRLFVGPKASPDAVWFSLAGGRPLYSAGEASEMLYFVKAGRLGVVRREAGHAAQFLGVIKPGEPAGEMALIAGTPHSADVVAMRDSEVMALPRAAFFAAARRDPALMADLAKLMILRTRETGPSLGSSAPIVFCFVGVTPGLPVRDLVEDIERAVLAQGFTCTLIGSESETAPTEWFSTVELRHDVVLMSAEAGEESWIELCTRQADQLFLVGDAAQRPPALAALPPGGPLSTHRLVDLILVHDPKVHRPTGTGAWLDAIAAEHVFHIRKQSAPCLARIARMITGTSVGLVLSGGGARAYAHVGVIRALREAHVPIDFIAGASMGAIIAAGVAMGWEDEEVTTRIRKAFVLTNPLSDLALPMIAMTQGKLVRARLYENFQDTEIEDLWLPFFCVSSNLTTGEYLLHRRGRLRKALQASAALPGVIPPVIIGDNVLVDGAVTNNMPADIMRRWHRGTVIGIDVAEARALTAKDVERPPSLLRWVLSGEWKKGPPLVSLLIRAATVGTARETAPLHEACDLLVMPTLEGIELRDWKAFDPAVEGGYQSMMEALARLDRPVTDLRLPDVMEKEIRAELGM